MEKDSLSEHLIFERTSTQRLGFSKYLRNNGYSRYFGTLTLNFNVFFYVPAINQPLSQTRVI